MKTNDQIKINDQVTSADLFNIEDYTNGLAEYICKCSAPMTIAVQGSWGSGKTSMMRRIQKAINDDCSWIEINTWQYSQFELGNNLPLVFYKCLIEKTATVNSSISEEALKLVKHATIGLGRFVAGGVTKMISTIPVVGKALEAGVNEVTKEIDSTVNAENRSLVETVEDLKNDFNKLVEERLSAEKKERFVIFIDDLDRIPPARAVELMEILKILLECENCVFVLAIDYDVVVRGVRSKYGNDIDNRKARGFFDKIIQVPFSLPVGKYDVKNYIQELLKNYKDCGLKTDEESLDSLVECIRYSVGCNPRAIKRVLNSYQLLHLINKKTQKNTENILFASLCMQLAFESIYEELLMSCNSLDDANSFLDKLYKALDGSYDPDNDEKTYNAFAERIRINDYSDAERYNLRTFFDMLLESLASATSEIDKGTDDSRQGSDVFTEEGFEILKNALKFSSSTVVTLNTGKGLSRDNKELPKWISDIYQVVSGMCELSKGNLSDVGGLFIASKKVVSDETHVNESTIADKCTRTFGRKAGTQINTDRFVELAKGFLDKNIQSPELIELLTDAVKHSRDADKEEVVRNAFITLREEKVLNR